MAERQAATPNLNASNNNALRDFRGKKCGAESGTQVGLASRPNRRGEMPVAIISDEKSGQGRALYPGQSYAAVAARAGFVDYTVEPVGARHV